MMLGLFQGSKTDQRRPGDQALLRSIPELKNERDELAEKLKEIRADVDAGRVPERAFAIAHEKYNYVSRRINEAQFARNRLIDGCPNKELRTRLRKLCDSKRRSIRRVPELEVELRDLQQRRPGLVDAKERHAECQGVNFVDEFSKQQYTREAEKYELQISELDTMTDDVEQTLARATEQRDAVLAELESLRDEMIAA